MIKRVALLMLLMLIGAVPALGQPAPAWTIDAAPRLAPRPNAGSLDRPALKNLFAGPAAAGQKRPVETERRPLALKGRPPDPWLGFDKVQHAAFSFLWTLGSQYTLVNKMDLSEGRALPFSMGSGAAVGLAKEVYDWQRGSHRTFSYRDLAADAFGIVLAAGLISL